MFLEISGTIKSASRIDLYGFNDTILLVVLINKYKYLCRARIRPVFTKMKITTGKLVMVYIECCADSKIQAMYTYKLDVIIIIVLYITY